MLARLPTPRGPISAGVVAALLGDPRPVEAIDVDDPLAGDDFHLALYVLYELVFRGFDSVPDDREWDPGVLEWRAALERRFETALRAEAVRGRPVDGPAEQGAVPVDEVVGVLEALAHAGGPSLSEFVAAEGTLEHVREFAVHRSAYQLKEADAHSLGLPRLHGRAKSALVEIQADEYGGGVPGRTHAELFADTLRALSLDADYGAYIDRLPGATLATSNLVSMFGLHRRLRGALVGHLALFEMCSVVPMSRYAGALRRLGVSAAAPFYDVHVEADARHERLAVESLVVGLLASEPALAGDVVFGASALSSVEARFASRLLDWWSANRTSLLEPPSPRRDARRRAAA